MPKFDKYYVIEYRFPVKVEDTETVIEAASKAARMCERIYGVKPDNWYARIFEYTTGEKVTGPVKEYFFNPNSASVREIDKNIGYFNDLISKGAKPEDLMEPEKVANVLEKKEGDRGVNSKKKKANKKVAHDTQEVKE